MPDTTDPPAPKVLEAPAEGTLEERRDRIKKELDALLKLKEEASEDLDELVKKKEAEIKGIEERIGSLKDALETPEEGETFEAFQARKTRELEEIEELERLLQRLRRDMRGEAPGPEGPPASLEEALESVPAPAAVARALERPYSAGEAAPPPPIYANTPAAISRNYEHLYHIVRESTLERLRGLNYNRGNWSQRDVEDYDRIKYEVQRVEAILQTNVEQKYFRSVSDDVLEQFDAARKFLKGMGYER